MPIRRSNFGRRPRPSFLLGAATPWDAAAAVYAHNLLVATPPGSLMYGHQHEWGASVLLAGMLRSVNARAGDLSELPPARLGALLRRYVAANPDPRPVAEASDPDGRNARLIVEIAGLDPVEAKVFAWQACLDRHAPLRDFCSRLGDLSLPDTYLAIAAAIGCTHAQVRQALSPRGRLVGSGLVQLSDYGDDLRNRFGCKTGITDLLTVDGLTREDFVRTFLPEVKPSELGVADFPEIASEVRLATRILAAGLRTRARGVNVLLYGPTGTGKSSLAAIMAREAGVRILQVGRDDGEGNNVVASERLSSLLLGQKLLGGGGEVLLFDEVEDLFSWAPQGPFGGPARANALMSKQWFNHLLEDSPVPTVWISNAVDGIDPAFLRRFSYAIEVEAPGPRQRARVLQRQLGEVSGVTPEEVESLARRFDASPGQIATAVATARLLEEHGRPTRPVLEQVLTPIDRILRGEVPTRLDSFEAGSFRLDGVCATEDLARLAERVAARTSNAGLPMLFHGPPGTGKSEYARYLAWRCERPLVYRRASDLLSMWVGGSEKAIAAAFRAAARDGAVLVFDEADSFLRNREGARQSWEVTQVNEFLQQLEAFQGVAICTTNLLDTLDPACIRRFVFKVGFRHSGPTELVVLVRALLQRHLREPPTPDDEASIRAFAARHFAVSPGDLAAVERRLRALGEAVSLGEALAQVAEEVRHKRERPSAGFGGR